jgi:hypothetical protein
MTVTIHLSPETEKKLQALAAQDGKDVPAYIEQLVEKQVREASNGGAMAPVHGDINLDELLAPVRKEFEESDLSEQELEQLVSESIREVREAKRKGRGHVARSVQEVETERRAVRDEWEERMRRIERIQAEAEEARRTRRPGA